MKLIWTENALADIDAILLYIAEDNIERAVSFTDELLEYPKRLIENTFIGVRYSEYYSDSIRLLIYKGYNIVYEVDTKKNTIIIHVVYHHSKKPKLER